MSDPTDRHDRPAAATPPTPPPPPGAPPHDFAHTDAASPRPPQPPHGDRLPPGPRTGPIIWGTLILAFCGYVAQRVFGAASLDTDAWIISTVIGLGALLLIVGLGVLVRNRR